MDRKNYESEMDQVKQASLGLEMVNHVSSCDLCKNILQEANRKVIQHLQGQS